LGKVLTENSALATKEIVHAEENSALIKQRLDIKMSEKIVRFKANASLKDIVGRGLIYDDNIAITELSNQAKLI
jgi:hypothetical protein